MQKYIVTFFGLVANKAHSSPGVGKQHLKKKCETQICVICGCLIELLYVPERVWCFQTGRAPVTGSSLKGKFRTECASCMRVNLKWFMSQ